MMSIFLFRFRLENAKANNVSTAPHQLHHKEAKIYYHKAASICVETLFGCMSLVNGQSSIQP
jgi:hypothetical protein